MLSSLKPAKPSRPGCLPLVQTQLPLDMTRPRGVLPTVELVVPSSKKAPALTAAMASGLASIISVIRLPGMAVEYFSVDVPM